MANDHIRCCGISTRGREFQEQGSSSDYEDQGRLPSKGGLESRRRSSAATMSRTSHPLGLLESDLLLVTKRTNTVFFLKLLSVPPRAEQREPGKKL